MQHYETSVWWSIVHQARQIITQIPPDHDWWRRARELNRRHESLASNRVVRPHAREQPSSRMAIVNVNRFHIEAPAPDDMRPKRSRPHCTAHGTCKLHRRRGRTDTRLSIVNEELVEQKAQTRAGPHFDKRDRPRWQRWRDHGAAPDLVGLGPVRPHHIGKRRTIGAQYSRESSHVGGHAVCPLDELDRGEKQVGLSNRF
jgi:hypothetical protein